MAVLRRGSGAASLVVCGVPPAFTNAPRRSYGGSDTLDFALARLVNEKGAPPTVASLFLPLRTPFAAANLHRGRCLGRHPRFVSLVIEHMQALLPLPPVVLPLVRLLLPGVLLVLLVVLFPSPERNSSRARCGNSCRESDSSATMLNCHVDGRRAMEVADRFTPACLAS